MSMRELDRLKIIQALIYGLLKPGRAAERLSLTNRQLRRLVNAYATKVHRASYPAGVESQAIIGCRRI